MSPEPSPAEGVERRRRHIARQRSRKRHPSWIYRRLTACVRPLPAFLIIGAQKCGTTFAYWYLVQHPRIGRAWRKEVHFFDTAAHYDLGEGWYRAHFPLRGSGVISGEATPEYLLRPGAPPLMARHVPDARLIALLRNPVDRTLSHYHALVRTGQEARTFEAALDGQPVELSPSAGGAASYLVRGLYAEQLENVLRAYPRPQLLVLRSEDMSARPGETVARMFEFLGLSAATVRIPRRANAGEYEAMAPPLRGRLVEFFRPHNARLYDLLGQDLGWDR